MCVICFLNVLKLCPRGFRNIELSCRNGNLADEIIYKIGQDSEECNVYKLSEAIKRLKLNKNFESL